MDAPPIEVPDAQSPPPMTLAARLTNIFVAPGEVFDDIKAGTPKPANWLTPMAIAMVMGIVAAFIMFSQPSILQKLKEERDKATQKAVDTGKMTQQVADQQAQVMDKIFTPTVMTAFGGFQAIVGTAIYLFLVAAFLWLLGTFILGGKSSYMQIVELVSTAMLIATLGGIVKALLVAIFGNIAANAGPILLIGKFDPKNYLHVFLAGVDVFSLWHVGVLSLGLAKLTNRSFAACAVWLYGIRYGAWLAYAVLVAHFAAK